MQIVFLFLPLLSLLLFVALVRCLLLYPEKPVRFAGITIQGFVHRARAEWTRDLATMAAQGFAGITELNTYLTKPENFEKLRPVIENHMDDFLRNRLKEQMPMISMFIGDKTITTLKGIFITEIEKLFPRVIGQFAGNLQEELPVGQLVADRLDKIPARQLTAELNSVLRKPFARLYQLAILLGLLVAGLGWLLQRTLT